jgi:hypothetical protein
MRRNRWPLLATAGAAAGLAGCAGGSTVAGLSTEAAAAVRSDRGMVEFARCMRGYGINLPNNGTGP